MSLLNVSKFMGHAKPFFAWQIELTTRCPLKCRMCVREGSVNWQGRDMKLEDFRKISEYFSKAENIILQGWGEPLLNRNLIDAVRMVKEKGARAGFVTSGSSLQRELISELIDTGTDFIGFSFAGATARTHNSIRMHSDFELLLENIRFLNAVKKEKRLDKPLIHIVYLMLKDNIAEVPAIVELAKRIGINDIILTNLIQVSNEWQEGQRVFTCDKGGIERGYREILKGAEIRAKELNVTLRVPSLSTVNVPVCEENPLRNLYISVDGEVSPCVYLYPPGQPRFRRIYCGSENHMEKVSFGNVFRESFSSIWNKKDYVEFRGCFMRRQADIKKIYSGFLAPPQHCRTCHKMLGV